MPYATLAGAELAYSALPKDGGYICIRAPKELQGYGRYEPMLPMFSIAQLSTEKSNADMKHASKQFSLSIAEAYIRSLCPVQPSQIDTRKNLWNSMKVTQVRGDRVVRKGSMGRWFTGYARARSLLKLLNSPDHPPVPDWAREDDPCGEV